MTPAEFYARNTHASSFPLVRLAHARRFRIATDMVARERPASVLDFGAGDGHLLWMLMGKLPDARFAAVERDREFLHHLGRDARIALFDDAETVTGRYDVITCLEVLEHTPLCDRQSFYALCGRALSPNGLCIVSVPIELGPPVVLKEAVRIAVKRRLPEWSLTGLIKASIGIVPEDPRRLDVKYREFIWSHSGFDYRRLRRELREHFVIEREIATPMRLLPRWLNHSVTFLLRFHSHHVRQ